MVTWRITTILRSRATANFRRLGVAALVHSLLIGCASNKLSNTPVTANPTSADEIKPAKTAIVADRSFTNDSLYALLVAEMAIDRRRYDIALGNYVAQASSTRDLHVAERATQIARGLNARQSALEMSQLWLELAPDNPEARLIATVELIEANRLLDAFALSKKVLASGGTAPFDSIAIRAEKGDVNIAKTLAAGYGELLARGEDNITLWLGQSILLQQTGDFEGALVAAKRASKLDQDPIRSEFQLTRVLHKMGKSDLAREKLFELVESNPNNLGLRARYARILWNTEPDQARQQFEILHAQSPGDAEILYSLALVEKDLGELQKAKAHFKDLIALDQYVSAAHYHLGDIDKNLNDTQSAITHYMSVGVGQNYLAATAKASGILINTGKRQDAIALIQARQQESKGKTLESLYLLEADIYSQAGQMTAAEKALSAAVTDFPDSTRSLYSRAMLYTQMDRIASAEQDLKRILELVPENAAALNALGYTLADRTDRYQEAYDYIKRAYALTPDDPAVLDSMGWIAYRLGNIEEAIARLREAMMAMPDHEIAAHLGEVLWVSGQQEEAVQIWRQGLVLKPESDIIQKTLHRMNAKVD